LSQIYGIIFGFAFLTAIKAFLAVKILTLSGKILHISEINSTKWSLNIVSIDVG
jgi:hypothetical protein